MNFLKIKNKKLKRKLIKEYHKNKLSTIKIAEKIGVSKGWVIKKMKIFNIPRRSLAEAMVLRMECEYGEYRKK